MPAPDQTAESSDVTLVKWGGSLITDKMTPRTARLETIGRLARELAGHAQSHPGTVILGHGSGSFGHVAALRHGTASGLGSGPERRDQLRGLCETQDQAAQLHRLVIDALSRHRVAAFSVAPSSAMTARSGAAASAHLEPLASALSLGLLPVVYGDVVLDLDRGSSVFSTEAVFVELARRLPQHGYRVRRALWLGQTDGILDATGARIAEIDAAAASEARAAAGESAGADVTGGMAHRLDAALELASLGADSWILDGRSDRLLARALDGDLPSSKGTRVVRRS